MKSFNKEKGKLGEDIACKFLIENGYEILERNKNFSGVCEIDIIAKQKKTLIIVEVKTRKNRNFGSPFEAITKSKYNHLKQGLFLYLQTCKIKYDNYRIDAIGVTLEPKTDVKHLQNIFI